MAKTFYIEDENGEFYSQDKTKRYSRLQGAELKGYLSTPEGRQKRFYIEDDVGIEIPADKLQRFRKDDRRKQYVSDIQNESPYYCVPLSVCKADSELSGEEVIADESVDVEEGVCHRVLLEQLRTAMRLLDDNERQLIQALYLDKPPKLQKDLAEQWNVSQQAVSKQVVAVLKKLRGLLEK